MRCMKTYEQIININRIDIAMSLVQEQEEEGDSERKRNGEKKVLERDENACMAGKRRL